MPPNVSAYLTYSTYTLILECKLRSYAPLMSVRLIVSFEICVCVCDSEAAEATCSSSQQDKNQHEELKRNLQKAETLNKTYEKSLRENASQMTSVIEKMQKMVEQVTCLVCVTALQMLRSTDIL